MVGRHSRAILSFASPVIVPLGISIKHLPRSFPISCCFLANAKNSFLNPPFYSLLLLSYDGRPRTQPIYWTPVWHPPYTWNFTLLFQACSVVSIVFFIVDSRFLLFFPAVSLSARSRPSRISSTTCVSNGSQRPYEDRTLLNGSLNRQ